MDQRFFYPRTLASITRFLRAVALLSLGLSLSASAQSGMLMNNGSQISAGTGQVSIFADSTSKRGKIINFDFPSSGTGTAQVIATWPCLSTANVGGIVYGTTGGSSDHQVENCLAGNSGATGVFYENSSGVPAWGTVSGNTTKFATSTGTLTGGKLASWDANGNAQDSGVASLALATSGGGAVWLPSIMMPTVPGSSQVVASSKNTLYGRLSFHIK